MLGGCQRVSESSRTRQPSRPSRSIVPPLFWAWVAPLPTRRSAGARSLPDTSVTESWSLPALCFGCWTMSLPKGLMADSPIPAVAVGPEDDALTRVRAALTAAGSTEARPGSWTCPAHDDANPSLSVKKGRDRVFMHCFAGCSEADVLAAIGLGEIDLRELAVTVARPPDEPASPVVTPAAAKPGADPKSASPPPKSSGSAKKKIVATYDYRDEHGDVLYQVVRYEPKGFRQRRPNGKGGWDWKLGDTARVLYRLPEVLAAVSDHEPVWVAEGEKDCDALVAAGVCATCGAAGVGGGWRTEYTDVLRGAAVTVIADRDGSGEAHAARVSAALADVAASVRVVQAVEGKDAFDHLGAGHTLGDFVDFTPTVIDDADKEAGSRSLTLLGGGSRDGDLRVRVGNVAAAADGLWRIDVARVKDDTGKTHQVESWQQLSGFDAEIMEARTADDGAERQTAYLIEVRCEGHQRVVECNPVQLTKPLEWAARSGLGRAWIAPHLQQHVLVAVQRCSTAICQRTVYTHLGWTIIDGQVAYLHGGGAIGPDGLIAGVEVRLDGPLRHYRLPAPATDLAELREAVAATLAVLDAGPDQITVPLVGAALRAPLEPPPGWSVFVVGPTGRGKTAIARLVLAHWGSDLLEASTAGWTSTPNAIEGITASGANAVVLIDDWVSKGGNVAVAQAHGAAERVVRTLGNRDPRNRLRPDGSPRPPRLPKATAIITGESLPQGESLQARLVTVELRAGDLDLRRDGGPLCAAQGLATRGLLATSMASYVAGVAAERGLLVDRLVEYRNAARAAISAEALHARHPDALGELDAAWRIYLEWAESTGALTPDEATMTAGRVRAALVGLAHAQARVTAEAQPAGLYIRLLRSAVSSGRAHVTTQDGSPPEDPERWGWVLNRAASEPGYQPRGNHVGWLAVERSELWLDPHAAYAAAAAMGAATHEPLPGDLRSLNRDLYDGGWLAAHEMATKRHRYTARRRLGPAATPQRDVLVLAPAVLLGDTDREAGASSDGDEPEAERKEGETGGW